jgi:hypothetical protein
VHSKYWNIFWFGFVHLSNLFLNSSLRNRSLFWMD